MVVHNNIIIIHIEPIPSWNKALVHAKDDIQWSPTLLFHIGPFFIFIFFIFPHSPGLGQFSSVILHISPFPYPQSSPCQHPTLFVSFFVSPAFNTCSQRLHKDMNPNCSSLSAINIRLVGTVWWKCVWTGTNSYLILH